MRKNVVNAYEFFVAKMGTPVTPAELIAGADLGTGGSGPGPIVWNLKTLLNLPIETKKDGKTVVSYTLPEPEGGKKNFVEPALITEHYAKAAGTAPKKKQKTAPAVETIPEAAALEVATEAETVTTAEVVTEETAPPVKTRTEAQIKKANRDKIRRAAQKAAKEAADLEAAAEVANPETTFETALEDFPEFLKREAVGAE